MVKQLFLILLTVFCLLPAVCAAPRPTDADADGLPDYREVHKYFTDPHMASTADGKPDGDRAQRKEFTYTITTVMRILKPANPADMTDDYQDVRVLSQDKDSYTLEITYYPFNTNARAVEEDRNWRTDDMALSAYLQPTPAINWNAQMRRDLIAALKSDGIDPDALSDRDLVREVSAWAMRRAGTTNAFAIWDVYFPGGVPAVYPRLRAAFDGQKPDASWTDQAMFDHEVLGRQMYYNKVHGSCTSSSVYMATILRALGIPTRIVVCIPPADGNDPRQVERLLAAIHHHQAREKVEEGLSQGHGFANHLFNEVYVGRRWVRLNYDTLGQNILDGNYFGLLTHIATCRDISDLPLAQTWGMRFNNQAAGQPALSSVNPYMLLKASDHFGRHSRVPNPPGTPELRSLTVDKLYWRGDRLPPGFEPEYGWNTIGPNTDLLVSVTGWTPEQSHFVKRAAFKIGSRFVLQAEGRPDVKIILNGGDLSNDRFDGLTARVAPEDKASLAPGATYTLHAIDPTPGYAWVTANAMTAPGQDAPAPPPNAQAPGTPAPDASGLHSLTIDKMYWRGGPLPSFFGPKLTWTLLPATTDLLVSVIGWTGEQYHDVKQAAFKIGTHFVLQSPGHADVHLALNDLDVSTRDGGGFMELGASIAPPDEANVVPGAAYAIRSVDQTPGCAWKTSDSVTVTAPRN